MTGLRSNTFPEMTEEELSTYKRHYGYYNVTHYDPKLNCLVGSKYMSVQAFIDLNGLEDTLQTKQEIEKSLVANGSYTTTVHGHIVRINNPS